MLEYERRHAHEVRDVRDPIGALPDLRAVKLGGVLERFGESGR